VFRSHAPRAVVAALTAVVLIVGLMASTTSAAPKPSANRIIYFGDAPRSAQGNGVLVPSPVSAGNVFEFTLWIENDGSNRLTHAEVGYGSLAVAQSGVGASLPAGATIVSATLNGANCFVTDDDLGARCDLGDFDSGETATVQIIVNAPASPGNAFTYASFKVAENVADQGANRNTVYANSSFVILPTNSNSNATYKTSGNFELSTSGQTLVRKDSMTTTVSGPAGVGAISIAEEDCTKSCVGQIATVHVRDGSTQTPYLEWTLKIIGSIGGVITHTLDDGSEVSFSGSCSTDADGLDCIVSNTKNGNETTIVFRTATNGKVRAN
jgi:hypothetical protein